MRGWYSRGYLPHFDGGEVPQSLTFRLAGSIPGELLEKWRQELRLLPPSAMEGEVRKRIERHLDRNHGEALLLRPGVAEMVEGALLHFDGTRYHLHAWVVMPNHVHALVTILADHGLAEIVHSWKSFTASKANRLLGRTGPFWQREYFDRYVRDGRHYDAAVAYIEWNPVTANLCARVEDWPFSSARFRRKDEPRLADHPS